MGQEQRIEELLEVVEEEYGLNEDSDRPVLSFVEFVNLVNPKYKWSEMSRRLAAVLQRVAEGEILRLMVFMPPRTGKSELVSRLFSAYCLYREPGAWVGVNSYSADLAYTFSRAARANFKAAGGHLDPESTAVKHWQTSEGGGLWAAGVGGPITGKGFGNPGGDGIGGVGIIDDPLKNAEEATSEKIRAKQKDWYDSTFYTRAEEKAPIIVLLTRWHEDDLAGWLMSREYEEPEHWHIVSMEAIKEAEPPTFPPTCTVEPDWRQPGEAVCPERTSLSRLQKLAKKLKGYFWLALYQQRPRPAEGNVFKEHWLQRYPRLPESFEQVFVSVDATFKETKHGSFVVIQAWGVNWPNFYLIDQTRDRMGFVATKGAIRQMRDRVADEFNLPVAVLIEDKANGPAIIDELKQEIPGIIAIQPKGSKEARAEAVSIYYESGNVWLPTPEASRFSTKDYVDELLAFPDGATDDQVDASSQLIYWVSQRQRRQNRDRRARSASNW